MSFTLVPMQCGRVAILECCGGDVLKAFMQSKTTEPWGYARLRHLIGCLQDSTKSFTASSRKKGNRPSKFVIGGYSSRLDLEDPDSLRHFELTNTQTDIPESESSKFERDVVNSLHQTSNSSNTMLNKKHNDDCSSSNEEIISVKDSIKKLEERQLRMEKKIDQILDMTRSFGA